jgi:type VI secretion system protein ImpE
MSANELFRAGKLQEAIDAQIKEVKSNPADHGRRIFLFELLAFAGDLDRARKHIDAVQYDDLERDSAVQGYRQLLEAEERRRGLFRDGVAPLFLAEPPEHVQPRLEAVLWLKNSEPARAAEALRRAEAARPPVTGLLNGKPFASLRDYDDLFGDVLEVYSQGHYYWVPLSQVETLAVSPPRFPRDLLWAPARLELHGGPAGGVFLPVLYPGSHEHPEDQVKLGRMTDWRPIDGLFLGAGARTLKAGDDGVGLLEVREVQILGQSAQA